MSKPRITKKPTRKQVERALAILDHVIGAEDDIAFRLGKDIAHQLILPRAESREHNAVFTTRTAHRSERGIAREVYSVIEGVLTEIY